MTDLLHIELLSNIPSETLFTDYSSHAQACTLAKLKTEHA